MKNLIVGTLVLLMSHLPNVAVAEVAANQMVSTSSFLEEVGREQHQKNIQDFLSRSDVRQQMLERGISPDEAASRLATLSDSELRQLSTQTQEARYGGDILITVLVVVLIIYLIQRI